MKDPIEPDERAQAFTLEGFIGGLLVLAAVLFALQATIFTPTASGSSEETQLALKTQAQDVLVTTATAKEKDLSYYVRYWDISRLTFVRATNPDVGYGPGGPPGPFGERLYNSFGRNGRSYNVVVTYPTTGPNETDTLTMVYHGEPSSSAVVATYTITLYDSQTLTGPNTGYSTLADFNATNTGSGEGYYPIPDVAPNSSVYNVVEVRLIVW